MGAENRDAYGAEFETPKASRRKGHGGGVVGYPLSGRLLRQGGLDERRKLPQRQRGPGQSPGRKRVLVHRVGAHSTLGGHDIFARKICMKN